MPQPAHRGEHFAGSRMLAAGVKGKHELAGLGHRHPRLVADAPDAEAGHDERVPAEGEPLGARWPAQRAAEHRVVPVHREPALVGERVGVAGDHVAELAGGQLPVRPRLAGQAGQRYRAAQPVQDARTAGKQREAAWRAGTVAFPGHLAAPRLQVEHPLDRRLHRGPHPAGEPAVAGDQVLVPDAHREVGGVVALRRVVGHLAGEGGTGTAGGPRPGAVGPLGLAQPLVGEARRNGESAGAERHRALHVVPRVHVAVRPGDRAVGPLCRGDGAGGLQDVGGRLRAARAVPPGRLHSPAPLPARS